MRLIDADALKKTFKEKCCEECGVCSEAITIDSQIGRVVSRVFESCSLIDNAPTIDAAPVVRCRNCKHYNTNGCADGFGWCEHSGNGHGSTDNWFCADGERRNDDAAD